MIKENAQDTQNEVVCIYRGEKYKVRNNGSVCRQRRENKRKRPLDDVWTFGKLSKRDGYRKICTTPVHRIVATAYLGDQPSPDHVVDHIDTNRLNNRPENLRWVTRLQNILENPKTLRRIEKKWGSIEGLLNDPNRIERTDPIANRPWMIQAVEQEIFEEENFIESLTPLAMQRDWRVPSEFPMCPDHVNDNPLYDYVLRLEEGSVFSRNKFGESIVDTAELNSSGTCLSVINRIENGVKNYAVAKVTVEDGRFVHESYSTYFTSDGAEKSHCAIIGRSWEEPEGYEGCIDDYC